MAQPAQKSPSGLFVFSSIETTAAQGNMNRHGQSGKWRIALALAILAFACPWAAQAASHAEMISHYRLAHGERKVTTDPTLNRIAEETAGAMAARDRMDHAAVASDLDRDP